MGNGAIFSFAKKSCTDLTRIHSTVLDVRDGHLKKMFPTLRPHQLCWLYIYMCVCEPSRWSKWFHWLPKQPSKGIAFSLPAIDPELRMIAKLRIKCFRAPLSRVPWQVYKITFEKLNWHMSRTNYGWIKNKSTVTTCLLELERVCLC